MLIKCRECGKDIAEEEEACPYCGCPLGGASSKEGDEGVRDSSEGSFVHEGAKTKTSIVALVCIGIAILIGLWAWFFLICHHKEWKEATCTEPRTCLECGETEGSPLGHRWGNDSLDMNFLDAVQSKVKVCSACGASCQGDSAKMKSFVSDGKFLFTPEVFFDMYKAALKEHNPKLVLSREDRELLGYMIYDDKGEAIGGVSFSREGKILSPDDKLEGSNKYKIAVFVLSDGSDDYESVVYAVDALFALMDACDPSLGKEEVHEVGRENGSAGWTGGSKRFAKNGIGYRVDIEKDSIWVYAEPI